MKPRYREDKLSVKGHKAKKLGELKFKFSFPVQDTNFLTIWPSDQAVSTWLMLLSCSSVAKSCLTLCDPMDCSTPGSSALHPLELAQTQVHWVSDAIHPSCSLSPPSPPLALNLSQHQGLFQWRDSSYQVAQILDLQLQHQSFQWILRVDFL